MSGLWRSRANFPPYVGCMCRNPKDAANSFTYISDVFKLVSLQNKCFSFGDFNDDFISANIKLKRIINNHKLHQLIDTRTRVTSQSATLLDIIVTNQPHTLIKSDSMPCHVDHDLITVTINLRKPKQDPEVKTFRQLNNF